MFHSMTAFGSGEAMSKEGRFVCEIQSVNRRYLEFNISLPQSSAPLEAKLRTLLGEKVFRGQIQLSIDWQREGTLGLRPNLQLAKELKEGWEAIATKLEVDTPFDLHLLSHEKELFSLEESSMPEKQIFEAVEAALSELIEMREFEGQKLKEDLEARLSFLEKAVVEVESAAKGGVDRFREKLLARLKELAQGAENEERVLREVALFADKVDVTEEIVRFRIHMEKFGQTMEAGNPCGKKLDFLIQEMLREANTMGAKGQLTVEIKSELEKMREQVQNVE